MTSRYGLKTLVVESHTEPGGAAHSFKRRTKEGTFIFDSGPSLWAGMAKPSMNPLRQCLDAAGVADAVEWVQYDGWGMVIPQGDFFFRVGDDEGWRATLRQFGGPGAEQQWESLMRSVGPVTRASAATPPMVLRSDPAVLLPLLRCLPGLLSAAPYASLLNGPFSLSVQRAGTTDPFIKVRLRFALAGGGGVGGHVRALPSLFPSLHSPSRTCLRSTSVRSSQVSPRHSRHQTLWGEIRVVLRWTPANPLTPPTRTPETTPTLAPLTDSRSIPPPRYPSHVTSLPDPPSAASPPASALAHPPNSRALAPGVQAWLDYLAFALSGLDASGTLGAAVAYTLGDLYTKGAMLDYPVGGSGAVRSKNRLKGVRVLSIYAPLS